MSVRLPDLQLIYGVAGAREKFEALCAQLIRYKFPETRGIRVYLGDGGIDAYVGEWGESGNLHVFQVKFFPTELKEDQKKQVRESLNSCLTNQHFNTVKWTLCLPRDLSLDETTWFNNWKYKAAGGALTSENIDYWSETELLELLFKPENRGIKEAFFKEEYLTQIREMHEMLKNLLDDMSIRITESVKEAVLQQAVSRSVFQTAEQFYQPFLNSDHLFHHTLPLLGRASHLKTLTEFSNSNKQVALLPGPDGIGKSRLLLEALRQTQKGRKDLTVLMLCSMYTAENEYVVADGHVLIGVDDALTHDMNSLDELFRMVRARQNRMKLILAIRPDDLNEVKRHLIVLANFQPEEILELPHLQQVEDPIELAKAILGKEDLQHISQLVAIASDSPLIMLIAGGLLKRGKINHSLLALSHDDFRQEVLLRYQQVLPSNTTFPIPADKVQKVRELLYALRPFNRSDIGLVTKAATFLQVAKDQFLETLELLEKAGMVIRQGESYSSIPDALAYPLLEQACFFESGRVKDFGPNIVFAFTEPWQTGVLKRLAEIDLLKGKGHDTGLLTEFWQQQQKKYHTGSIADRMNILRILEDVAYFQPKVALDFVQMALQLLHPPLPDAPHEQSSTQEQVKVYLPGILGQVAYHTDHTKSALNLLWSLGKDDGSDMSKQNKHPHQVLQELSKQRSGQVVAYQDAFLDCIELWSKEEGAFSRVFTPLNIIPNFLTRDGYDDYYFSQTQSLHMQPFYVVAEPTKHIRNRALNLLASIGQMNEKPKLQFHAIEVLYNIILRGLLYNTDTQLRAQWYEEDRGILSELSHIVQHVRSPYISYSVDYGLRLALKHPDNDPIAEYVLETIAKIPIDLDVEVVWLLKLGRTAKQFSSKEPDEQEGRGQDPSKRNVAERFLQQYTSAEEMKKKISGLISHLALFDQKIFDGSFFVLLGELNSTFASNLCRLLVDDPSSPVVEYFDYFAISLRHQDEEAYIHLIQDALKSENPRLRHSAVYALCASREFTEEESNSITPLINDPEPSVAIRAIQVIDRLPEKAKEKALFALNEVSIAPYDDKKVNAICQVLRQQMTNSAWDPLPLMTSFLQKCILLPALSEQNLFSLLSFLLEYRWKYPQVIARFCTERVKHQKSLPEEEQHRYEPLSFMYSPVRPDTSTHDERENEKNIEDRYNVLCTIRDEFFSTENEEFVFIFAYFANGYDATALRALAAWVESSDEKKITLVARLIRRAPYSFIFTNETFVEKLLNASDAMSTRVREQMIDALLTSAMSLPFAYASLPGQNIKEHIHLRDKTREKAEEHPSDSALHEFYNTLSKEANYRIEMKRSLLTIQ